MGTISWPNRSCACSNQRPARASMPWRRLHAAGCAIWPNTTSAYRSTSSSNVEDIRRRSKNVRVGTRRPPPGSWHRQSTFEMEPFSMMIGGPLTPSLPIVTASTLAPPALLVTTESMPDVGKYTYGTSPLAVNILSPRPNFTRSPPSSSAARSREVIASRRRLSISAGNGGIRPSGRTGVDVRVLDDAERWRRVETQDPEHLPDRGVRCHDLQLAAVGLGDAEQPADPRAVDERHALHVQSQAFPVRPRKRGIDEILDVRHVDLALQDERLPVLTLVDREHESSLPRVARASRTSSLPPAAVRV